jgi:hypothetical protein
MLDERKAKLCPCPPASKMVKALFEDIVQRVPAGSFSLAHREALLSYCRLTIALGKLSRRPRLSEEASKKMTRITHSLRSIAIRLGLKELEWKAAQSEEVVVEQEATSILQRIESDPDHPRHGLLGARVRDVDQLPATPEPTLCSSATPAVA